ncbi:MAG: helix-turn-helix transcriptional regulator [Raoultibacter sp.]
MPIVVQLKREIARCGIKQNDLAAAIGISPVNLSRLTQNHVRAIRFSTLDSLCEKLGCGVDDILRYEPAVVPSENNESESSESTDAVFGHDAGPLVLGDS